MRRNASLIHFHDSSLKWLLEETKKNPFGLVEIKALCEELMELERGNIDSIVLHSHDQQAWNIGEGHLEFDGMIINQNSRTVFVEGDQITLTPKEFDILYFLAMNPGVVYTKEQIYQAVWGNDYFSSDSNIMAFIRKLRLKLEKDPEVPKYILTVWGVGYKFNDCL